MNPRAGVAGVLAMVEHSFVSCRIRGVLISLPGHFIPVLVVETYGLCLPINPGGVGTYGFEVRDGDRVLASGGGIACVGGGCNNVLAEYQSLIRALEWLVGNGLKGGPLVVKTTNVLMAYQLEGVVRVTKPYEESYRAASNLLGLFNPLIEVVDRVLIEHLALDAYVEYMDKHPEAVREYGDYLASEEELARLRGLGFNPHRYLSKYEYEELVGEYEHATLGNTQG